MSWDRRCIGCGGWLTDRAGAVRQCVQCGARYQFSGGMLTPVAAPAAEPAPDPQGVDFFGESASGTFDDPRRGRRGLYEHEVTYEDLFTLPEALRLHADAAGLVAAGRYRDGAAAALEALDRVLEAELFYPDEPADASPLEAVFERAVGGLGPADAARYREQLDRRVARFDRARDRLAVDPARVAGFRAAVGKDLGRFLGDRRGGFGDLPAERRLPLEGGAYRLVEAGEYRVGPPGGPARPVALDAFHLRTAPVTNGDYANFLERSGYPPHPLWGWRGLDLPNRPVVGVSWEDAAAYCSYYGGRLPTEAEYLAAFQADPAAFGAGSATWELLLDDAGDPAGPAGTQGVILLGTELPKALRAGSGRRDSLAWGSRRADTGFRMALDPRLG